MGDWAVWEKRIVCLLAIVIAGCAADKEARDDVLDSGVGDDTGTASEPDSGCGDERVCVGDEVHEIDCTDGTTTLIETCEAPRYCYEGACYFEGACGEAEATNSHIGCEYWAVDVDNASGTAILQPYAVAVGNVGTEKVHVKVEARIESGGYVVVAEDTISSKEVGVFKLTGTGVGLTPELQSLAGSYHQPRMAYRITSDRPVIAYQFNPYSGLTEEDATICSNDATLLIPTSGIDRYYFALAYPPNNGSPAYMAIIATEDATTVTITPKAPIMAGWDVNEMPAEQPSELTMNAADVAQLESDGDISGTYIEADKPIVVFAGNVTAFVPGTNVWFADHLEHQMIPLTKWGTDYIAARSKIRAKKNIPEKDHYRIIASEDDTLVETTPEIPNFPVTLGRGEVVQVSRTSSFAIGADKPIMVGQFLAGADATGLLSESKMRGDPSFALIAPVQQFLEDYVFLAPDKYPFDYVVITHPADLDVDLDGALLSSFPDCEVETFSPDWTITRCEIGDFNHTIAADEPVGITVWGYGVNVSYGYTGGLSLETINNIVK